MFLLDVNALLALNYTAHVHYERMHRWVAHLECEHGRDHASLATCPITELGFVRVGGGKAGYAIDVDAARGDLEHLKSSASMVFIPDDLSTRHLPVWARKPAQTTDGYLLALAKSHGMQLATLDRFIPDAVFIPEETAGPFMVREERVYSTGGSHGITLR